MRFVTDTMLGKLSKWLRVMGYDTHYQSYYPEGVLSRLVEEGRKLLSRRVNVRDRYSNALWLHSDHVHEQLRELKESGSLPPDKSKWFSRCLVCNATLVTSHLELNNESVPDHVLHQRISDFRSCPLCRRVFWPGSHRERMIRQLAEWGF